MNHRHAQAPRLDLGNRGLQALGPLSLLKRVGTLGQFVQLPAQPLTVGQHGQANGFMQGIEDGSGIGHQVIAGKFIRAAIVADLAIHWRAG
jgi:hypothetical protein